MMDEKELGRLLEEVAEEEVPGSPGMWPEVERRLSRESRTVTLGERLFFLSERLLSGAGALALLLVVALFASWLWFLGPDGAAVAPTATTAPQETVAVVAEATPTADEVAPAPDLSMLRGPGWVLLIEQHYDSPMATVDSETGEVINTQGDFLREVWALLNEEGLVTQQVTVIRDMQGNELQVSTWRDGVSRNLTLGMEQEMEELGPLLPWADPENAVYHDPLVQEKVELVTLQRVEQPPGEVLALLAQEVADAACENLALVDESEWEARALYERWLDGLVQEANGRWLHTVIERRQNEAAIPYENYEMPLATRSRGWTQLDEAGDIVARVGITDGPLGEVLRVGVVRDGWSHDLVDEQVNAYRAQPPDLDLGFFANVDSMESERRGLAREEVMLDGKRAIRFTACQSYQGARPRMGDLPLPVVGEQRHLWLDAESGQVLRSERVYVDTAGEIHLDSEQVLTTVSFVETLPAEAQVRWEEAGTQEVTIPPELDDRPQTTPLRIPDVSLTVEDITYGAHETVVEMRIELQVAEEHTQPKLVSPLSPELVDEHGNRYRWLLSRGGSVSANGNGRWLSDVILTFEPVSAQAQTLTLRTGLGMVWPASEPLVVDLQDRKLGDRWPLQQELIIGGMSVPVTEAAWVNDPGEADGHLTLQITAPCVVQPDYELVFLELLSQEAASGSDGVGGQPCGLDGAEEIVASLTIDSLLNGETPASLQSVTLFAEGRLHLTGPWSVTWDVEG
jgi:hypothetical protein